MANDRPVARAVLIKGPFTESEWRQLLLLIRHIEGRHPTELYEVVALNPNDIAPIRNIFADVDQARAMLERTFPRRPGEDPLIVTKRLTDD